ncbi:LysM peptidoglycan-binding domain-containing protein [Deinococcus deserti]|uniref:LysM peptidoglycan-binding domain-containing protein n=1 Tax=Deinococcus deserti TaxID=310783 RepID=UPI0002FB846A|nr:LysM peptidoglycan-binding domain-containing protein [Deinococcus deserti]
MNVIPAASPIPLRNTLPPPAPVLRRGASNVATYTVQRGDTLSGIAASHGTTVAQLQIINT